MNPDYPAAWILLGHEFVEGKNHAAAINAYREALGKLNNQQGKQIPFLL
jgi:cytochrome c-type biogenesis protein CcmH/NrfG